MAGRPKKDENARRTKGDGGVTFIKNRDLWCAQLDLGIDENGKRIRKSFTAKTQKEALEKKRAFLMAQGQESDDTPTKRIRKPKKEHPLAEYADKYLKVYKLPHVSSSTFVWYRDMCKHIINGLGDKTIESLDTDSIQEFFNNLTKSGKSPKTIKEIRGLLNQILEHALDDDIISKNPLTKKIKIPKVDRDAKTDKAIRENVCKDLMDVIKKHSVYKPMITILLSSGIRIGELLAMKWENIDRTGSTPILHIKEAVKRDYEIDEDTLETLSCETIIGKTKTVASARYVPADPVVLEVLDEWEQNYYHTVKDKAKAKGNEGLIFPNKFGDLRTYSGLRRQFQRFLEENGLGHHKISFHCFRHTFATMLMEESVSPRVAQELLGHCDIETTLRIYTSVTEEIKEREVLKLSGRIASIING
jgi:integrase